MLLGAVTLADIVAMARGERASSALIAAALVSSRAGAPHRATDTLSSMFGATRGMLGWKGRKNPGE